MAHVSGRFVTMVRMAIYTYLQALIVLTDRRISPSENISFRILWNSFELFGILLNSEESFGILTNSVESHWIHRNPIEFYGIQWNPGLAVDFYWSIWTTLLGWSSIEENERSSITSTALWLINTSAISWAYWVIVLWIPHGVAVWSRPEHVVFDLEKDLSFFISYFLEFCWTLWNSFESFGILWKPLESFLIILNHFESFWILSNHFDFSNLFEF